MLVTSSFHGSGESHATIASPEPSFRVPWGVGDAVASRRKCWVDNNQRVDMAAPCHNCLLRPIAYKTGRGSLLNRPSYTPDDPIGQRTELN